ncbi:MAK10-like protein [Tanacetum coccineum]
MASQDARLSKFEADFKQQQSRMTNKIDTVLKAITDRILNVNSTSQFCLLVLTQHIASPMFISPSNIHQCVKSFPRGMAIPRSSQIARQDVEVHIGNLKVLNDFYVIDMNNDPETPLLVGRGFLATANAVIDCRKANIAVGEGITRSVFRVKRVKLGEEEAPYWTTLGKRESYKPRSSSDGVGARTPYYARKDFLDCHLPGEWEIARDAEINPFKDVHVFRRMVEFLGAIPINLKRNMWESKDLIQNPIDWNKPPKNGDVLGIKASQVNTAN